MEGIENRGLLSRIRRACGLDDRPLLIRLREMFGDLEPVREPYEEPDPLCIPKARDRDPLRAASKKQFDAYMEEVRDLRELRAFLDRNRDGGTLVRLVEKMTDHITRKAALNFDPDEDNAERLAGCVLKHVLEKHVGKISKALYHAWHGGGASPNLVERDLTEALNAYLMRLGIYSVIARVGGPFSDEISEYYDIYSELPGVAMKDEIADVVCPAYVLEYMDEDEALQRVVLQGKCLLKVSQ